MSSTHIRVKLCIVTLWTIDCFEANIGSFAEFFGEKLGKPCSLSQKIATFAQEICKGQWSCSWQLRPN